MSKQFVIYDLSTGQVLVNRVTRDEVKLVNDYLLTGNGYVEGEANSDAEYVNDGVIVPRPTLPSLSASYDLTAMPIGTVIYVTDESDTRHEITELTETLILQGPQTYIVRVNPPFPYVPIETKLEVS